MARGRPLRGESGVWPLPADLLAVLCVVGLALLAVLVPGVSETPLLLVLGLPFVLFVPGYAFVAALFPAAGRQVGDGLPNGESLPKPSPRGVGRIERLVLSVGVSVVVVPLIGVGLAGLGWEIRLVPVTVATSGFTLVCTALAVRRRVSLPREKRFTVSFRPWWATVRRSLFGPDTVPGLAVNLLVVAAILLAMGSVGYAVVASEPGAGDTEFQVLTTNETGDPVAGGYPGTFTVGEPRPVTLGVANYEREPTSYTVVVQLQRVDVVERGNETTVTVEAREELDRLQFDDLAHAESRFQQYQISPTMAGDRLRLVFLLYRDDVPATPTVENAYRDGRLWIDVEGN